MLIELLFWFSLFFILYTYFGYPCLLLIWAKLLPKKVNKTHFDPSPKVSIIIAAHNEERNIRRRILNLLNQDYPPYKLEIILVSDGSTDATNHIVRQYIDHECSHQGESPHGTLKFVELDERKGKARALNIGVSHSTADFIVFADSRQTFERTAVKELIANFSDRGVGSVSGELVFHEDSDSNIRSEMGFYWALEKTIRKMESAIHSVAGATGCIYAIRKCLFEPIPEEILLDDVFIPMRIILKGHRNVFDGEAIAYDNVSQDFGQEKRRKLRTLLGNYQLLKIIPELLSPIKNPIFFRYLSHKVFRLLVPFFFISLLFASLIATGPLYRSIPGLIMLTIFFLILDKSLTSIPYINKITKLARTFYSLNYFALLASIHFLLGTKKNIW